LVVLALLLALPASAAADNSMAVQPDGKIVLSGQAPQPFPICRVTRRGRHCQNASFSFYYGAVVRFDPDGSLDTGFGADGGIVDFRFRRVLTNPWAEFPVVALQPNGQIVVGADQGFRLARYGTDGGVDPNFGDFGVAGDLPSSSFGAGGWETFPAAVLARADGTIAVGGTLAGNFQAKIYWAEAAARLYGLDGGFKETLGEVLSPPGSDGSWLLDLISQPDGTLIGAGRHLQGGFSEPAMLVRFVPGSGAPYDTSFAGGKGFAPFPAGSEAHAVVSDAGKLIAAGSLKERFLLARFDSEGIPDPSFGEGGVVAPAIEGSLGATATAVAVQPDGKIVVAGESLDSCQTEPLFGRCWDLLVSRFNSDGTVDSAFGHEGVARLATPNDQRFMPGDVDLAILSDGKILLSEATGTRREKFVLARYDADGKLDPSFGEGGVATALPCQGAVAQRRSSGCIGSAAVRLGLSHPAGPRPHGNLQAVLKTPLDPMVAVRVLLPPALRGRPASANRVKVLTVSRHKATVKVYRHSIVVNRMGSPRGLHIGLPSGVLGATRKIVPGHKLIFRVKVKYRDGSTQTLRVEQTS
jgi:uncharacterized delta-60 repeat protein